MKPPLTIVRGSDAEFARLLVDGGILLFSITHPCFFCYDWGTDEKGERAYKEISDYLTPKVSELNFWGKTLHFHRPLSHYFDVLSQNGFCVDVFKEPVSEPVPSEEVVREHPNTRPGPPIQREDGLR